MEILASGSAAEMVGTKTGDVGKFFFFRWHLAKATTSIGFCHIGLSPGFCFITSGIVTPAPKITIVNKSAG